MENLNIFKEYKQIASQENGLISKYFDGINNLKNKTVLFLYLGSIITLCFSLFFFATTSYLTLVVFLSLVFSFLIDFYFLKNLEEDTFALKRCLFLILFMIVSLTNITWLHYTIAILVSINLIGPNFLLIMILWKDYNNFNNLERFNDKRVVYIMFNLVNFGNSIAYKILKGLANVLYWLIVKTNFLHYKIIAGKKTKNTDEPYEHLIFDLLLGTFNILREYSCTVKNKSPILFADNYILKFILFLKNIEDDKKRDSYKLMFYLMSGSAFYKFNCLWEKVDSFRYMYEDKFMRKINMLQKHIYMSACEKQDLFKDFKSYQGYYTKYHWNDLQKDFNIDEVVLEMKELFEILNKNEPDLFKYLIENEMNIFPFLFLQDFILTDEQIQLLENYNLEMSKEFNIIESEIKNNKSSKIVRKIIDKINVIEKIALEKYNFQFDTNKDVSFIFNELEDYTFHGSRETVNDLHLGIEFIINEMQNINPEILMEKDMLLLLRIRENEINLYFHKLGLLEKNNGSIFNINPIVQWNENKIIKDLKEFDWMNQNVGNNNLSGNPQLIKF